MQIQLLNVWEMYKPVSKIKFKLAVQRGPSEATSLAPEIAHSGFSSVVAARKTGSATNFDF